LGAVKQQPVNMTTPLSSFLEPLRICLGDRFGASQTDDNLTAALRHTLNLGRVTGHTLAADRVSVTPELTTAKAYGQLLFRTTLSIAFPDHAATGYGTRAWNERFGDAAAFIAHLQNELADMDEGWFASWQDLGGFVRGHTSRDDFWQSVVSARVQAPFRDVVFTASGTEVSQGAQTGTSNPAVVL
jgi:hypothetical protein